MTALHTRLLAFGICISSAVPNFAGTQTQEKRPSTLTVIEPAEPEASLAQVWAKSPVVVRVVVQKTLPPQADERTKREVSTLQILKIEEVLKGDNTVLKGRRTIRVRQYGGTVSVDGREAITPFLMPLLKPGQEAVLFLSPEPDSDVFLIHKDSQGAYVVNDQNANEVTVTEAASRLPELRGRRSVQKGELMQILRSIQGKQ